MVIHVCLVLGLQPRLNPRRKGRMSALENKKVSTPKTSNMKWGLPSKFHFTIFSFGQQMTARGLERAGI